MAARIIAFPASHARTPRPEGEDRLLYYFTELRRRDPDLTAAKGWCYARAAVNMEKALDSSGVVDSSKLQKMDASQPLAPRLVELACRLRDRVDELDQLRRIAKEETGKEVPPTLALKIVERARLAPARRKK